MHQCITSGLKRISLQGCPQITGNLAEALNKNCRSLQYVNLAQCKQVKATAIEELFNHTNNRSLDLSFIS